MKLLIVGSDNIYAIENFYVKYLKESGIDVKVFPSQTLFDNFYQKNIINKLLFKAGISAIHKKIKDEFIKFANHFKPDVIWIFKGMELVPSCLVWARQSGIKLVNYNPDSPFLFSGKGSGNKNIIKAIPLYHLHFTYNLDIKRELENKNIRSAYLPFGFDVDSKVFDLCRKEKEIIKTSFVGNPDGNRALFLEQLAEKGIAIDVYGRDWKKYISNTNISIFNTVSGNDFWKTLRKYRVQLNLMRPHNLNSHNMRSFEIPGIGGIMLAPDTPEHRSFFLNDKEIFLFSDLNNCIEKINYLLNTDMNEADKFREQARSKSLAAGYTYKNRSKQALTAIQQLLN